MFSYLQMPFLQALGYAIANSLWQIALLWLIVVLVNNFAKQSSHIRYITALSAQIAGFVWFVTTYQFYYNHCHAASVEAQQLLSDNGVVYTQNFITGNDSLLSFIVRAEETLPYLSIAYLFLLILLVVKWIRNFYYTKQLAITGLQNADAKWQSFINEMADRLNIIQDVKIYLSTVAKSPLTIGYIKPVILVPIASINHLSSEQLEAVLLHELAHIKRSDYMINLLISITEIILFFNPFTRLISRIIQKERENCCDDWVLQFQYNANMYAEALLRIAYIQRSNSFEMNAATQKKGELLQRIKRMVQPNEKPFNYKHQLAALLLITGILFSLAWLHPNDNSYAHKSSSNIKEINKQIVITPLTAQIDNPLFSAASLFSKSLQEDVNKSIADLDKTIADSIAQVSLQQAQVALQQAAPAVISTVSSGNWQKIVQKAKEGANESIKNIDWKKLQQSMPGFIDSSFVIDAAHDALNNVNVDVAKNIKTGLDDARQQLVKLQQKKEINFNFSPEYLQQLTLNAFASLKTIDFKAITDSIAKASAVINKLADDQKKLQQNQKTRQLEWIRKIKDSYKKTADAMRRKECEPALLTPPLPPAIEDVIAQTNKDVFVADFSPATTNTMTFSEPVFHVLNTINHSKIIHITNNTDSSIINITIEIRQ